MLYTKIKVKFNHFLFLTSLESPLNKGGSDDVWKYKWLHINGGNNQILPNATEAVQNFYGDQYAEKILGTSTPDSASIPELGKLSLYIDKVNLPGYISQIGECLNATEFARIVISIFEQESRLTEEEIVKERFIRLLLPFATKLEKGRTIDNLRARINDALLSRPKPNRIK